MNAAEWIEDVGQVFPMKELNIGDASRLKVSGMTFFTRAFKAQGLGHVCLMEATGFFGWMNMTTLVVAPTEIDLPLCSMEFIRAMGKVKFLGELYETRIIPCPLEELRKTALRYEGLKSYRPKPAWYDSLRVEECIFKEGKKAQQEQFAHAAKDFLSAYLSTPAAVVEDLEEKRKKTSAYVEGLLEKGGPAVNVFKKSLGEEKTADFLRKIMFGTAY